MDCGGDRGRRCMDGRGNDSDINRILLRYRPIAPKPVVGGTSCTSSTGSSLLSGKRTKRKYVRVSGSMCKKKDGGCSSGNEEKSLVTLQLLPERSDLEADQRSRAQFDVGCRDGSDSDLRVLDYMEMSNNYNDNNNNNINVNNWYESEERGGFGVTVESRVTVESVTAETCTPEVESWWRMNDNIQLETDSCPGFISEFKNGRAEWVNMAYRRMVGCGSDEVSAVWIEIKEEAAVVLSRLGRVRAFSCWVKVEYYEHEAGRKRSVSMVVPCDVWRVERGGFAWRLDARAALCLGMITDNEGCRH